MGFETVHKGLQQRQMKQLGHASVKVAAKLDLKTPAKKILSAAANCYLTATERSDSDCKVTGRVVTRVIYMDEFDAFNSEERSDNFTAQLALKGHAAVESVSAASMILETSCADLTAETKADAVFTSTVDVDSVVEVVLIGLVGQEIKYVANISGNAEAKLEKKTVATFSRLLEEKFTADERLELDKNCSGVLGVDVAAHIRDINCNENKVSLKGIVSVNVIAVKTGEISVIYNSAHEFDFSKTLQLTGIGIEDSVIGSIAVGGVTVKAENKTKPELSVEVDLVFSGAVITAAEIEYAADVMSFDNHLSLTQVTIDNTAALPQSNTVADIESNMTMPANAPYISKILSVGGSRVSGINLIPADGKITVEGVLSANLVYECEEKLMRTHEAQVPFSTVVRIEGVNTGHTVQASVQPVNCNIKARRGKELLIDARLGLSIACVSANTANIPADVIIGDAKVRDDSAIMIYIASDKETLWDIAKRISVSQSEIIKQNPHIASETRPGDKIFIYRQNVINF